MNDMGSKAIGGATGTVYRLVGASLDRDSDGAGGYGTGASTLTASGRQQYVGPGGTSFSVSSRYHLTVTPEGTLVAERLASTLECR